MPFQCVGHCLENLDAGGPGASTPVFKEPACDGFVGLLPDLTEILFQIVGDRQHQLHDVKSIKHMLRIRKVFQHGGVVRTGHVGGHRFDVRL